MEKILNIKTKANFQAPSFKLKREIHSRETGIGEDAVAENIQEGPSDIRSSLDLE